MVGLGLLMLVLGLWSLCCALARHASTTGAGCIAWRVLMGPAGFVAVLAGWITTEVGRQPYTVYGLLRTADSVSPIDAPAVGASLLAFVVVYFTVFGAGVFYILRLMARSRRDADEPDLERGEPIRAAGITPAPALDAPAGDGRELTCMRHRSALHLGRPHRLRGARLCRARRLRSRHRHPVPASSPARTRARRDR